MLNVAVLILRTILVNFRLLPFPELKKMMKLISLQGYASGSFGPTTAGRMDSYLEQFQAAGGSKIMLAKGNRSKQVVNTYYKKQLLF